MRTEVPYYSLFRFIAALGILPQVAVTKSGPIFGFDCV